MVMMFGLSSSARSVRVAYKSRAFMKYNGRPMNKQQKGNYVELVEMVVAASAAAATMVIDNFIESKIEKKQRA